MKKIFAILIGCLFTLPMAAQVIKQYSGEYPRILPYYWYELEPTASYSYYDDPAGTGRIFHGPFKFKFHGDGSTSKRTIYGSISGNFKDDYQDGEWTMIYPIHILSISTPPSRRQRTGTFKCTFVNGRLNGDATYVVKENATGKIMFSQKVYLVDGVLDGPFTSFEAKDGDAEETVRGIFKNGKRVGTWTVQYAQDQYLMVYDERENEDTYIIDHRTGDKSSYGYPLPRRSATSSDGILNIVRWFPMRKSAKMEDVKKETAEAKEEVKEEIKKKTQVYTVVEQRPQFPGGDTALLKWVNDNLRYPAVAKDNNIQGRILVKFVVTETGKIGEVKVVRAKDPDLDKEAVRVVKALPDFIPGKMNGEAVSVWETLPITFRL